MPLVIRLRLDGGKALLHEAGRSQEPARRRRGRLRTENARLLLHVSQLSRVDSILVGPGGVISRYPHFLGVLLLFVQVRALQLELIRRNLSGQRVGIRSVDERLIMRTLSNADGVSMEGLLRPRGDQLHVGRQRLCARKTRYQFRRLQSVVTLPAPEGVLALSLVTVGIGDDGLQDRPLGVASLEAT